MEIVAVKIIHPLNTIHVMFCEDVDAVHLGSWSPLLDNFSDPASNFENFFWIC